MDGAAVPRSRRRRLRGVRRSRWPRPGFGGQGRASIERAPELAAGLVHRSGVPLDRDGIGHRRPSDARPLHWANLLGIHPLLRHLVLHHLRDHVVHRGGALRVASLSAEMVAPRGNEALRRRVVLAANTYHHSLRQRVRGRHGLPLQDPGVELHGLLRRGLLGLLLLHLVHPRVHAGLQRRDKHKGGCPPRAAAGNPGHPAVV
mmetsp:Transcript_119897/g.344467  ORF Transcript_119897/g.344467 Transcript_119897/m.344467 type:complete len:203 (+) Transcript_119897:1462-2070(+)